MLPAFAALKAAKCPIFRPFQAQTQLLLLPSGAPARSQQRRDHAAHAQRPKLNCSRTRLLSQACRPRALAPALRHAMLTGGVCAELAGGTP